MTPIEITTVVQWAAAGSPEGDRRMLPEPLPSVEHEWTAGVPDLDLRVEQLYVPPADADSFRCFVLETKAQKSLYVAGLDFKSSARSLVHHIVAYLDKSGASEALDDADPGPGYSTESGPGFTDYGILGAWFPGAEPLRFPEGVAIEIPAGARIVLQVHYHPHEGVTGADQSEIGLYLAKSTIRKVVRFMNVESRDFVIPANQNAFRTVGRWQLPRGIEVYAAGLHAHALARAMSLQAVDSDGARQCLLSIEDYDWRWQGMYRYRQPLRISAGTFLEVQGLYDNSSSNPDNHHHPPEDVVWGELAHNEMCIGYLAFTWEDESVEIVP